TSTNLGSKSVVQSVTNDSGTLPDWCIPLVQLLVAQTESDRRAGRRLCLSPYMIWSTENRVRRQTTISNNGKRTTKRGVIKLAKNWKTEHFSREPISYILMILVLLIHYL